MSCLKLNTAALLGGSGDRAGPYSLNVALETPSWASRAPMETAVVPQMLMVLPVLTIRTVRKGLFVTSCRDPNPRIPRLLLLVLPSLLPELASGTLVSALRMFGLPCVCRIGIISMEVAVISPTGGKCEPYSSARLIRFFAHISAMPSIADWNSAPSADRKMSANEKAAIGGRT